MRTFILLWISICFVSAAYGTVETPYPLGDRDPTPEEQAYLDAHVVKITTVAPNEAAVARTLTEALVKGTIPQTLSLPSMVDNSLQIYFPPIRSQGSLNSCAAFAAAYYFATYTQAKDEGWDASSGNDDYICSPKFVYNLTTFGKNEATSFAFSQAIMCDLGCCSWTEFPYDGYEYVSWPSESAWIDAIDKRMDTPYMIDASTTEGIEAVKQRLANGDICTSHFDVHSNFWGFSNSADGIDNYVYYTPVGSLAGGHGSTILGYDDDRSYVDHRDGQTYYGAFLCANSWGTGWGVYNTSGTGTRGFYWVAYRNFLQSTFGPEVYFNSDRQKYRPRMFALTRISLEERGQFQNFGGIGPTASPLFQDKGKEWDGTDKVLMDDTQRVAVDISDGLSYLQPGTTNNVFSRINVLGSSTYNATVSECELRYDLDATGTYSSMYSSDPTFVVSPGSSGFATFPLTLPAARIIYVDASNTAGPWDGSSDHPFQTIQDGIDDATFGDTVLVRDGTYTGTGNTNISFDKKLITVKSENGAKSTIIDCEDSARGFIFNSQETQLSVLDGFTITNGYDGTEGGAIFCLESSPIIENCILKDSYAGTRGGGICFRKCLDPLMKNCLIVDNASDNLGGGVHAVNGFATVTNCTIVGNTATSYGGGAASFWNGAINLSNSIIWGNSAASGAQLALGTNAHRSDMAVEYCCVEGGEAGVYVDANCALTWDTGNISSNPLFTSGPDGDFYLSQLAAGQTSQSPCVNAGNGTSTTAELNALTTRTDGSFDSSTVDMGYHYPSFLRINSIEISGGNTIVRWTARAGENYTVRWSADMVTWNDVYVGQTDSWTDSNPVSEKRFYMVMGE